MHRKLSFLILTLPFFQIGCGSTTAPETEPGDEEVVMLDAYDPATDPSLVGFPIETIQQSYLFAYETGSFETVLSRHYILPALRQGSPPTTYTDGQPTNQIANPDAVEFDLNPVSPEQMSDAETYFTFIEMPTHLLEITIPVDESMTITNPVYLVEKEKGFLITPPSWKEQDEIAANLDQPYKKFYEDGGMWKHHWEFKFSDSEPLQYELVLHNFQDEANPLVIVEVGEITLTRDDPRFYLHLIPDGQDSPVEETLSGENRLSYAYQAGSSSMSSSIEVPFDSTIEYFPDDQPVMYRGQITLAYFGNDYALKLQAPLDPQGQ